MWSLRPEWTVRPSPFPGADIDEIAVHWHLSALLRRNIESSCEYAWGATSSGSLKLIDLRLFEQNQGLSRRLVSYWQDHQSSTFYLVWRHRQRCQ